MSNEHDSPEADLNAIEAALGSLVPSKSRINRDRLMFEAGRASARRASGGRRAWMAVAASLALIASGEGALLALHPAPRVVERIVVVREPAKPAVEPDLAPDPIPTTPPSGLVGFGMNARDRLAVQVLRYGLDGLPAPGRPARSGLESGSDSSRLLLEEELRKVLDLGDPS